MLAQPLEDACDGWVFKVLRHHGEFEAAKAPDHAHKLEVAEVWCHPHSAGLPRLLLILGLWQMKGEKLLPSLRREPRGPEQVEEGAGKDLV
jgi:hypothetical protein